MPERKNITKNRSKKTANRKCKQKVKNLRLKIIRLLSTKRIHVGGHYGPFTRININTFLRANGYAVILPNGDKTMPGQIKVTQQRDERTIHLSINEVTELSTIASILKSLAKTLDNQQDQKKTRTSRGIAEKKQPVNVDSKEAIVVLDKKDCAHIPKAYQVVHAVTIGLLTGYENIA